MAVLKSNARITAVDHFQDTRHVVLDLGKGGPSYDPGDILSVMPRQSGKAVSELLEMMGLNAEACVRIELSEPQLGHPSMEVKFPMLPYPLL